MDQQDGQAAKNGRTKAAASDLNRLSTTGKSFLLDPDSRRGIIQELQTRLKAEQQKRRDLLLRSSNNVSQAATSSSTTEVAQHQQMDNSKLFYRAQVVAPSASASPPKQISPAVPPGAEKLATAPAIINTSCQTYPRGGTKELVTAPVINGETYETLRAEATTSHNLEEKVLENDRIISECHQSAQSAGGEGRKSYGQAEDALTPIEDRMSIDQQPMRQNMLVKPATVTAASEMSAPPETAPPKSTNLTSKFLLFMKSAEKPATTQVESSPRSFMRPADTSGTPTWLEKHLRAPGGTMPNQQAVSTPAAITPLPPKRTTALPCLQCLMRSLQESGLLGSCWHAAVVELEEAFAIKNLAEATIGKSEASAGGESLNQMLLPASPKKDGVISSDKNLHPTSQHDVNKWKALEKLCFLRNSLQSCSHHSA